jgi:hypothetical protein
MAETVIETDDDDDDEGRTRVSYDFNDPLDATELYYWRGTQDRGRLA